MPGIITSRGGEELYDETKDPYEWSNLAGKSAGFDATKGSLQKYLPTENKPPATGGGGKSGAGKRRQNTQAGQ